VVTSSDSLRAVTASHKAEMQDLAQAIARLQAVLDSARREKANRPTSPNRFIQESSTYRDLQRLLTRVDSLRDAAMGNPGKYYYLKIR
jgi:hypothetical protein